MPARRFKTAFGDAGSLYCVSPAGDLYRYVFAPGPLPAPPHDPPIDRGGWDAFEHLFCGEAGILYAVDASGALSVEFGLRGSP